MVSATVAGAPIRGQPRHRVPCPEHSANLPGLAGAACPARGPFERYVGRAGRQALPHRPVPAFGPTTQHRPRLSLADQEGRSYATPVTCATWKQATGRIVDGWGGAGALCVVGWPGLGEAVQLRAFCSLSRSAGPGSSTKRRSRPEMGTTPHCRNPHRARRRLISAGRGARPQATYETYRALPPYPVLIAASSTPSAW